MTADQEMHLRSCRDIRLPRYLLGQSTVKLTEFVEISVIAMPPKLLIFDPG